MRMGCKPVLGSHVTIIRYFGSTAVPYSPAAER
jgi:hypothetical protein